MRFLRAKLGLLLAFVILASLSPSSAVPVVETGQGPALASIGPLTFGPGRHAVRRGQPGRGDLRPRPRRSGQRRRRRREGARRAGRETGGTARHGCARGERHRSGGASEDATMPTSP